MVGAAGEQASVDMSLLPIDINSHTVGKVILQGITSMQYVSRAIGRYFMREYVMAGAKQMEGVVEVYRELPEEMSEIKRDLA